jgi:hypothetical protein
MELLFFLDREKSIARPRYSRWLVPPAALAIHLYIGQVYAFSVFKIPLTQLLGMGKSLPDSVGPIGPLISTEANSYRSFGDLFAFCSDHPNVNANASTPGSRNSISNVRSSTAPCWRIN